MEAFARLSVFLKFLIPITRMCSALVALETKVISRCLFLQCHLFFSVLLCIIFLVMLWQVKVLLTELPVALEERLCSP